MSPELAGYVLLLGIGVGLVWLETQLLKLLILEAAMSMGGHGVKKAKRRLWAIPLGVTAASALAATLAGLNPVISLALLGGPLCITVLTLIVVRAYFSLKRKGQTPDSSGSKPPGNAPEGN
jgi:hypothetical protein